MPKLDRTYGASGNIFDQKKDASFYKGLTLEKIGQIFAYLNSVSFNYDILHPPKMDKTVFSSRKN
jgi:hypothetical protein